MSLCNLRNSRCRRVRFYQILQRSKERGLDVSVQIFLGLRPVCLTPGPTITSIMDFRKVNNDNFGKNIIIKDGIPASSLSEMFAFGVSFAAKMTGEDKSPSTERSRKHFR